MYTTGNSLGVLFVASPRRTFHPDTKGQKPRTRFVNTKILDVPGTRSDSTLSLAHSDLFFLR